MDSEYRFTKDWPHHVSCGGIVYRYESHGLQVLLLKHHNGHFDIPKGTLRLGETLEQCAQREVAEESGQVGDITGYLGGRLDEGIDKSSGLNISKITHYFAMKWTSDTGTHDHEYESIAWVTTAEARAVLKPSGVEVLDRFGNFVATFPDKF